MTTKRRKRRLLAKLCAVRQQHTKILRPGSVQVSCDLSLKDIWNFQVIAIPEICYLEAQSRGRHARCSPARGRGPYNGRGDIQEIVARREAAAKKPNEMFPAVVFCSPGRAFALSNGGWLLVKRWTVKVDPGR